VTTVYVLMFIFSIFSCYATANSPRSVSGYVYSNGEQIITQKIVLSFPSQEITANLFPSGFYIVDFNADPGDIGIFYVTYNGGIYTANETIIIESGIVAYEVNLNITTPPNHPPNKPINPIPENNTINVSLNPEISVLVSDPDADYLKVKFYNASNDQVLGIINDIANNSVVKINWPNLAYNQSYSWYATANDSKLFTRSETFNFKTRNKDITSPVVSFEQPKQGALYISNFGIPMGFLKYPTALGRITIKINATDEGSGIDKVDLEIKGRFKTKTETLTEEPYEYNWNSFGFGKFNLTAVAYDNDGNSASASMDVRKFF